MNNWLVCSNQWNNSTVTEVQQSRQFSYVPKTVVELSLSSVFGLSSLRLSISVVRFPRRPLVRLRKFTSPVFIIGWRPWVAGPIVGSCGRAPSTAFPGQRVSFVRSSAIHFNRHFRPTFPCPHNLRTERGYSRSDPPVTFALISTFFDRCPSSLESKKMKQ